MNPGHRPLRELAGLFLRLGATAFGGPAAHIAVMRHEVVDRRAWMTDADYAELIALANLVPGPNSTEVAMHVGRVRAGRRGLVVAGVAFILPAFVLMTALAWGYVRYGDLPRFRSLLVAMTPVVLVVVVDAGVTLARSALRRATTVALALAAGTAAVLGAHEVVVLVAAGGASWGVGRLARGRSAGPGALVLVAPVAARVAATVDAVGPVAAVVGPVALVPLFLAFLEIGAVLYGSGYVLYALLEQILVEEHHWVSQRQLLDAIAAGQLTPGPLFTTATFLGFTVRGLPGAVVATVGIFLPAFVFVGLTDVVVRRLRGRPGFTDVVDGVVAASLGLLAAVAVVLGRRTLADPVTVAIAVGAAGLLWWRRPHPIWLVLGAAAAGFALPHLG